MAKGGEGGIITGIVNAQYHSRTRTGKIEALNRLASEPFMEIHPDDAGKYGAKEGVLVRVSSRRGSVTVRVNVTDGITKGAVFIPYHFGFLAGDEKAVNVLTNRSFDETANQPEYKACAVKIEIL